MVNEGRYDWFAIGKVISMKRSYNQLHCLKEKPRRINFAGLAHLRENEFYESVVLKA